VVRSRPANALAVTTLVAAEQALGGSLGYRLQSLKPIPDLCC
jgi:hypothetical protein